MRALAWATASLLLAYAPLAHAQDTRGSSASFAGGAREDIGTFRPYWGAGDARPFVAVTFENAGIAGRTQLDLGYGKPHHQWAGVELTTQISLRSMSGFLGVRATAPWGTVRFGPRFVTQYSQRLIEKTDSVTRTDLDQDEGIKSHYLALDADANFSIALPVGSLGVGLLASGVFGVEEGYFVMEDALRVPIDPPFVGRGRLSYLAGIGVPATLRVGGVFEAIINPEREMVNLRTGPAVAVSLTHHLEAVGVAAFSIYNPDEIGLAGADVGQIGLRYKWATGDLWPDFP